MPRSNKKKYKLKPPPKHPSLQSPEDTSASLLRKETRNNDTKHSVKSTMKHPPSTSSEAVIATLFETEKNMMIERTIISGQKHGVNLMPGSSNPGTGNCAFESIIQNNNDRSCFRIKYPMSVDYYRRIWVNDMANRTLDTDWNILSSQQWMTGWEQMKISGTYERGIFGDLMLPGIACGVRKFLLIFNTNTESPHDPIYVVDPTAFKVRPDSEIPIVLSYNLSHYESIHPCTATDIQVTVNLVRDYLGGRYSFGKKDFPFLLGLEDKKTETVNKKKTIDTLDREIRKEIVQNNNNGNSAIRNKRRTSSHQDLEENKNKKLKNNNVNINNTESDKVKEEILSDSGRSNQEYEKNCQGKLCYKLINKDQKCHIKEEKGKMECPICRDMAKNMKNHFQKNDHCGNKIDLNHFSQLYEEFTKQRRRDQKLKSTEKIKQKDPKSYRDKHNAAVKKANEKAKLENASNFKEQNKASAQKSKEKAQVRNPAVFKEQNKASAQKSKEKAKVRNPAVFKEQNKASALKSQEKAKVKNCEIFKEQNKISAQRSKRKAKEKNPETFDEKNKASAQKSQAKVRAKCPEDFVNKNKKSVEKLRKVKNENTTQKERFKNFNEAVLFGPICICSSCKRRLYENGVAKITQKFKTSLNEIKPGLYHECISKQELINIVVNGKTKKTGHYICHTCKSTMNRGKIPSMSLQNGLELTKIMEGCHLTELENNLIALNINFQYIFCLKKSRWAATKKQIISVPVTPETVLNTVKQLPRLPKEAGLVEVKLKRKKEYDNCHKKEYVDPKKIYKVLEHLKKSGHKYYQFYEDFNSYEQRCKEQDKIGHTLIFEESQNEDVDHEDEKVLRIEDNLDNVVDEEKQEKDEIDRFDIEEITYLTKDPIRKHQFDHNRNTCMTNNYPEMFIDENGRRIESNAAFSFAPAEGNYPANILDEEDWDIRSWPALHPDGRYGLHHERRVKLSDQQYFGQRILNQDRRFSESPDTYLLLLLT